VIVIESSVRVQCPKRIYKSCVNWEGDTSIDL
jgi:hypothetical protein